MLTLNKSEAPNRERDGLLSHILLQRGDLPDVRLTVTWVEVAPCSGQRPHNHASDQVYIVIKGRGEMRVGDERQEVSEGDLVFIPPNVIHGIDNVSGEVLVYVAAATPAINVEAAYDTGQLRARTDDEGE